MYEFSSKSQPVDLCMHDHIVVGDTANVRVFKQITTQIEYAKIIDRLLAILQMYEFSSKSQPVDYNGTELTVVGDTANVRVFKQITTRNHPTQLLFMLLAILQMYEFSSKSQRSAIICLSCFCCWRYCKCTSFQANHNEPGPNQSFK